MLRKTTKKPPRSLLFLFFCILVSAAVLGGMGIPLVSSEGMVIRTHLIEGDLPTTPEDPTWAKVSPDDAAVERPGDHQACLAGANRARLECPFAFTTGAISRFCWNGRTTRRMTG